MGRGRNGSVAWGQTSEKGLQIDGGVKRWLREGGVGSDWV
jgi:hypothetical protein